ncbi:MAG TPA: ATP-binding protein, partial [Labilithrix sp.]|nr:ATP-binding protein [Labilithrix sp.]
MLTRGFAGEGGLLFFVGEPGIGKTRLADLVAREGEERGFRVAWGRCWEAGGAPAFWPWSEIFRALGGEDPFRGTGDAWIAARDVRFQRFGEARQRLEQIACESPLLLVLDDLHASDVPSLSFLHMFARTLNASRIVVIGTY